MVSYIDDYRDRFGVEPICRVLPIASSTYYELKARQRDPERRPPRAIRDERLKPEIRRVWDDNYRVYGARKVWKQLKREGLQVARCTVVRPMREMGLRGVVRGRKVKTTLPAQIDARPLDRVNRDFKAGEPNRLWVADLTYGAPSTGKRRDDADWALSMFGMQEDNQGENYLMPARCYERARAEAAVTCCTLAG
jgi:transposase InsO family protein